MMSERAMVDKNEFERIASVSNRIDDLRGCIMYMREADTTDESEGVLIYIPFANPGDLIEDLRGDYDE